MEMTDQMWWKMCDAHMSRPVPLLEADLSKPYVYDREYGVFYVPMGYHQMAMTVLLSFHLGENDLVDMATQLGLAFSEGTADRWLEGEGRCFKSSVSNGIKVGFKGNLSFAELQCFGKDIDYILED